MMRTPQSGGSILAPMPGRVMLVHVKRRDKVEAGTALLVLEAMKMEHVLRAPDSEVVGDIRVREGDQVKEGDAVARARRGTIRAERRLTNSPAGERDDNRLHEPVFIVVLTTHSRTQLETGRNEMADNKSKRGKPDRREVAKGDGYEVSYFARKHRIRQQARKLIERIGNDRAKLNADAAKMSK